MLWHRQASSTPKETSCLPLLNAGFEAGKSETPNRQQTECPPTNRLSYRGSRKTWTQQPVPIMSEHSAHLTSLPIGFRTWLWRYTCLLLLFLTLWHRQTIFKSQGDKLSSSAESRIRNWAHPRPQPHSQIFQSIFEYQCDSFVDWRLAVV